MFSIKRNSEQILCTIHNLPGKYVNPNKNSKERPVLCESCLIKVEDQLELNKKLFLDFQNKTKAKIDRLNIKKQEIINTQNYVTHNNVSLITLVQELIDNITLNYYQIKGQFEKYNFINRHPIETNEAYFQLLEDQLEKQIQEQLQMISKNSKKELLIKGQEQVPIDLQLQYSEVLQSIEQNKDYCYAIAINSDNSIVAVGCSNKIRIFELKNDKLNEIQELLGHSKTVQCLNFMRKSKQLVSACYGGEIRIWQYYNNQWLQLYFFNDHQDAINCLQINQKEDLIISGSADQTIKFWSFGKRIQSFISVQWQCDQTLQMNNEVDSISLNQSSNKLIVCLRKQKLINLIKLNGNLWEIVQGIHIPILAYRLCYIDENQFAVQLSVSDKLLIFKSDGRDDQFKQVQEIKVKKGEKDISLFPMQFIQSKGILIGKNCQYINIIRKQQNGEFNIIQIIDLAHCSLFGCVSDNGQYLITWDRHSNQISIRKLYIQ